MDFFDSESFVNRLVRNAYARDLCVFNPYRDRCRVHDQLTGPQIRRDLLRSLVDSAIERGVEDLWVGSCPGWRGARRTGLAFTDDFHINEHCLRWGCRVDPSTGGRSTRGRPVRERTAGVVWSLLRLIDAPVFLWNAFPFHPHQPGQPFTNRALNKPEKEFGGEILDFLIDLLRPNRLVAVGNDADKAVTTSRLERYAVRHPSYGGVREFMEGMAELYGPSVREALHSPDRNQQSLF